MKSNKSKAASLFGLSAAGFVACVALAFISGGGQSSPLEKAYSTISNEAPVSDSIEIAETPPPPPQIASAPSLDPESVKKGKLAYDMYCLACHGPEDTTITSPSNLFDNTWYHGSDRDGIEVSIRKGIMEKGMPGWEVMITPEEITALVDYLLSFQKPAA